MIKNIKNIKKYLDSLEDEKTLEIVNHNKLSDDCVVGTIKNILNEFKVKVYKSDMAKSTCTCKNYEKYGICNHITKLYYEFFDDELEQDLLEAEDRLIFETSLEDLEENEEDLFYELSELPLNYYNLIKETLNKLSKNELIDVLIGNSKL